MNTEATKPVIQPTGEATGFIPAPGDKGKPITVIGTAAIRDAFDAKCIEQALNSRGAPGVTSTSSSILTRTPVTVRPLVVCLCRRRMFIPARSVWTSNAR